MHPGGGLHLGRVYIQGGLPKGGVCIQGGLGLGRPPQLEKRAVRILLECFLVRHLQYLSNIDLA